METVLVTGATGALGPHLLAALLRELPSARLAVLVRPGRAAVHERFGRLRREVVEVAQQPDALIELAERLFAVEGDIRQPQLGMSPVSARRLAADVRYVVHAAADTRFLADAAEQEATNVAGTASVIDWARQCPGLERLVLVSTTCVAGRTTGLIAERLVPIRPEFVNAYEQSKWEAEQLAARSGLPLSIVRLATCVGGRDGCIFRLGAVHLAMQWMLRGLVPMVPGRVDCPVDLIASDLAAAVVARAARGDSSRHVDVCQVSAGAAAPRLDELVAKLADIFREREPAWRRGQIEPPVIVAPETFSAFRQTVEASGDMLFHSVLASLDAFLPSLLYPKDCETESAERLYGDRLPVGNWQSLVDNLVDYCLETNWGRSPRTMAGHA